MTGQPIEAITITIDLEASLGRIEDDTMMEDSIRGGDDSTMECEHTARTSNNPFATKDQQQQHSNVISPYPLSETECERKALRRLSQCGVQWPMVSEHTQQTVPLQEDAEWVELKQVVPPDDTNHESDDDDDNFSLSSEGSESLKDGDELDFEKIEDPVSFFEKSATDVVVAASTSTSEQQQYPTVIPPGVSFASSTEQQQQSSTDMAC